MPLTQEEVNAERGEVNGVRIKERCGTVFPGLIEGIEENPFAIFWDEEMNKSCMDFDELEAVNTNKPAFTQEHKDYIMGMIGRFENKQFSYTKYPILLDYHGRLFGDDGIGTSHEYECEDKLVCYSIESGREFEYCVLVEGYDRFMFCGKSDGITFLVTPTYVFRTRKTIKSIECPLDESKEIRVENALQSIRDFLQNFSVVDEVEEVDEEEFDEEFNEEELSE